MFAPVEIVLMTWSEFLTRTNINGASNIGSARSLFRKIIWAIIFVGGLVLTTIALVSVISGYLDYGVSSSSILEHYSKVNFPSVTVCNQNRVDCSTTSELLYACNSSLAGAIAPVNTTGIECQFGAESLAQVIGIWELVCNAEEDPAPDAPAGGDAPAADGAPDAADGAPDADNGPPPARKKRATPPNVAGQVGAGVAGAAGIAGRAPPTLADLGSTPAGIDEEYKFLGLYMQLSEADRKLIGHQFGNLVKECVFRERDCTDEDNFLTLNTPSYGNCFTFNSAKNDKDPFGGSRVSSMSGPNFGLTLVLNIEQGSYQTSGTMQAGARFTVHDPTLVALPMEYGRDLKPNTAISVAMQEVAISRQPAPFTTNCSSSWDATNYTDYIVENWQYSLSLCQRLCLLSSFELECNCFHPLYLDSEKIRQNYTPCELDKSDSDTFSCVYNIMQELDNGIRNCSCHVDCDEVDYSLFMSESLWPSLQYEKKATTLYGTDSRAKSIDLGENLLQVNAYFASLNVQTIKETPIYESVGDGAFIAALGGGLSLYLGISIAMFFEIVEFIIDLGLNSFLYVAKGKRIAKK